MKPTKKKSIDFRQGGLGFGTTPTEKLNRNERYQLIRLMTPERCNLSPTRCENLKALLTAVHDLDHGDGCWEWATNLAKRCGKRSLSWLKRTKADAVTLEVLVVSRRSKGFHGRDSDSLSIDWRKLAALDSRQDAPPRGGKRRIAIGSAAKSPRAQSSVARAQIGGARAQIGGAKDQSGPCIKGRTSNLSSKLNLTPLPPEGDEEWREIIEEVKAAGVDRAEASIEAAAKAGGTPDDVRALLAYWNANKSRWRSPSYPNKAAYVLYRRLTTFVRGALADKGWSAFDVAAPAETITDRRIRVEDELDALSAGDQQKLLAAVAAEFPQYAGDAKRLRRALVYELARADPAPSIVAARDALSSKPVAVACNQYR